MNWVFISPDTPWRFKIQLVLRILYAAMGRTTPDHVHQMGWQTMSYNTNGREMSVCKWRHQFCNNWVWIWICLWISARGERRSSYDKIIDEPGIITVRKLESLQKFHWSKWLGVYGFVKTEVAGKCSFCGCHSLVSWSKFRTSYRWEGFDNIANWRRWNTIQGCNSTCSYRDSCWIFR